MLNGLALRGSAVCDGQCEDQEREDPHGAMIAQAERIAYARPTSP